LETQYIACHIVWYYYRYIKFKSQYSAIILFVTHTKKSKEHIFDKIV